MAFMGRASDIILQWYEEIWTNGHVDQVNSIYAPAPPDECVVPQDNTTSEEAVEIISALTNLITQPTVKVLHIVETEPWVCALVELRGFKAGTEKPVELRWINMARIADNRIVESYRIPNLLAFFEQLGQLPDHSFELLLSGTKLK